MRRDLQLDCEPAELVLAPPDRSQLKEIFRRFEFRNLLRRVDELDEALPARRAAAEGVGVPWREDGRCRQSPGRSRLAVEDGRCRALATARARSCLVDAVATLASA